MLQSYNMVLASLILIHVHHRMHNRGVLLEFEKILCFCTIVCVMCTCTYLICMYGVHVLHVVVLYMHVYYIY